MVEVIISLPATTMNIGAQLSKQYAQEKEMNRKMLIKILLCIQFLARQGLQSAEIEQFAGSTCTQIYYRCN